MTEDELYRILNELGEDRENYRGAVAPPIHQTAMFAFPSLAALGDALGDELATPFYTRGSNPTVELLRRKVAALEGAEDALVFASGSAAISSAVLALLEQGDEVLCVSNPYSWTGKLMQPVLGRFGIVARFVDGGTVADFETAISERTRLIILESPNSLTFSTQDLPGIAALARQRGIITLCDNSYATPLLQQPIEQGIDLVAHSATKYLNGHSDVVAGVLCGSEALIRRVFDGPFMTLGGILGPLESWLLLRGLRTLPVRLARIRETTGVLLEQLEGRDGVKRIHYPGPELGTGLFTLELATEDVAKVATFVDGLEHFLITCSWGGHESLIYPLCALERAGNYRLGGHLSRGMLRISIGLEPASLLSADLERAFARIGY